VYKRQGYAKRAIEDYFDYNVELEYLLDKSGKHTQKQLIRDVSDVAQFVYIRQKEQLGTGHALLQAKNLLQNEPFLVISGDDIYQGRPSRIKQMVEAYEKYEAPVLFTMQKTDVADYDRYGYIEVKSQLAEGVMEVGVLLEKPGAASAPSPYASFFSHVLTPDIFPILESQAPGKGGEIWLSDAIDTLAKQRKVIAIEGKGLNYFDCGNKLEYMKACVEFALDRQDIGPDFRAYLQKLLS
jgi:UTP--glucose-1-phosphate uridylyltransferase